MYTPISLSLSLSVSHIFKQSVHHLLYNRRVNLFGVTKICYVYAYDLRNKDIKTGGHRSYKKMGAVPKVRIGDKTLFLSRSRTLKKIFARYDSVTYTGNVSIYMICKNMT